MPLLDQLKVVDFSQEVAGPYCSKLLADQGADVVKVEPPSGDRLRRWTAGGIQPGDEDSALFQYLNTAKRSLSGNFEDPTVEELVRGADVLIDDGSLTIEQVGRCRSARPQLIVVSITPFGRTGPWTDRPATEFTLQALCGSIASTGPTEGEPVHAGGRLGEWLAGVFAACATAAAIFEQRRSDVGTLIDLSIFECMCFCMGGSAALNPSYAGKRSKPLRSIELPSIEPTADGYVGFCTLTAQQCQDFFILIDQPELLSEESLLTGLGRDSQSGILRPLIHQWTSRRTSSEIEELAAAFRIPVAPVASPKTITTIPQYVDREVFVWNPSGAFRQPRPPFIVDGKPLLVAQPAPDFDSAGFLSWPHEETPQASGTEAEHALPLEGLRIVDLTAFKAGPVATAVLGALGAEIVKIESIQRPDGMRFYSSSNNVDQWWEYGRTFQACNANKLGVTIDLSDERGRGLFADLLRTADALIENFSPRVMENFGLTWDHIHRDNPALTMVRMPAFGLTGPWRDRTAFAPTIEQASGMAWMTGEKTGPPIALRGPCDPLAGLHAAFGLLVGVVGAKTTGIGHHVECPMIDTALGVAAQLVVEHDAYGIELHRDGNRGPVSSPQGVYSTLEGGENRLALAVATDEQWLGLRRALGDPDWSNPVRYQHHGGRREDQEIIDAHLCDYFATRTLKDSVSRLIEAGVPAAPVVAPDEVSSSEQLLARRCVESVDHSLLGNVEMIGMPFRFSSYGGPWMRTPAPMLGQHNLEVFGRLVGLTAAQLEELSKINVIGTTPVGV